jgi:uncharacterized membrane protein
MTWLVFGLRWFHLIAAMILVGGTIFMRFALVPSVGALSDDERKALHQQVRSRWSKLVMASIAFLLVSGFINYVIFYETTQTPAWEQWHAHCNAIYQAAFGVKFLLAMAIFFIASAVSGRSESMKQFRQNAKLWLTVNVILGLTVVALAGVMRLTHVGPTVSDTEASKPAGVTAPAPDING